MDEVESRLSHYVSKELFNAMQASLLDFATNDTVEHVLGRIHRLDERFITITNYDSDTEALIKSFEEKMAQKLSIGELNEHFDIFEGEILEKLEPI